MKFDSERLHVVRESSHLDLETTTSASGTYRIVKNGTDISGQLALPGERIFPLTCLVALFWIIESVLHFYFFHSGALTERLFKSGIYEFTIRTLVTFVLIVFCFYTLTYTRKFKSAEKKIRTAYGELNQIFDTAADGMCVVDKEFNVLRINDTFSRLFGISKKEAVGAKCYDVFGCPDCDTPKCSVMLILEGKDRIENDVEKKHRDGHAIPCILTALPFKNTAGEVVGVVGNFKDISVRKKAELQLELTTGQLKSLASHLQDVREEERIEVARNLHDELSSLLTVLKMGVVDISKTLVKIAENNEEFKGIVNKTDAMEKTINHSVKLVRKIITRLRPGILDDLGLIPALEWYTEEFRENSGIHCVFNSDFDCLNLETSQSTAVFRIFQETLMNTARHSQAQSLSVNLKKMNHSCHLLVVDNGRGFRESDLEKKDSYGLMGVRERAKQFGWQFNISGSTGKGTRTELVVTLPEVLR